jgi:hypothetical protein
MSNIPHPIWQPLRRSKWRLNSLLDKCGYKLEKKGESGPSLISEAILGEAGVAVSCVPVFGTTTPENGTRTWHGIQEVALQFLKLHYYRISVLPFERHVAKG